MKKFHSLSLTGLILLVGFAPRALLAEEARQPARANLSIDDLFSEQGVVDVAISPSGKYLAAIMRQATEDYIVTQDLATGQYQAISRFGHSSVGEKYELTVDTVYWKTDDRILLRSHVAPARGLTWRKLPDGVLRLGYRLLAIDRDGKNLVRLLSSNHETELSYAFDQGTIRSILPGDPDNILVLVDGIDGRSLFKVNVRTGKGTVVEKARPNVEDWWLDLEGRPVVRVESDRGSLRFYRRESAISWKKFYSVRRRELKDLPEYEFVGPSKDNDKFYVLARPGNTERIGIYLYDVAKEEFGSPVIENPAFDIISAKAARDGTGILRYCYLAHVRVCEMANVQSNAHMVGIRKYFRGSANVYVPDQTKDGKRLILYVQGPSDPPAYYQYDLDTKQILLIGLAQESMAERRMPTATVINYKARDGMNLNGYLTRPPGAEQAKRLPLVMLPHGGPEARDFMTFDPWVQYLAARGYAVFQPNFRGSDGFGRHYAASGYGQWGRKMQDDIGDALALMVSEGIADPQRVCIVGASYGGYAALAGATLTQDLYKCAVSVAGVADLASFLQYRRRRHGENSEVFAYWMRTIGDPQRDAERIAAVSPVNLAAKVNIPILLIHGDKDEVVPIDQSQAMKRALDASGHKTELIVLEDEGHSYWSDENQRRMLTAVDDFLLRNLGPGFIAPDVTARMDPSDGASQAH